MGYDVSFHPVDVAFVREKVIPFVRGERDLDDLMPAAIRITRARFRANAWGLGVMKLEDRGPAGFDTGLHVWGRPFFITADTPDEVSEAIDRYLDADDETAVDAIARDMLRRLDLALPAHVAPSMEGHLPDEDGIIKDVFWRLELFRRAYAAVQCGEETIDHDGDELDAAGIFATDFPMAALTFMAHFRPGWMSRGYVWPTHLLESAGVDDGGLFQRPEELFAPLARDLPQVLDELDTTITQNDMIGGYVPAARTGEALSLIRRSTPAILTWARGEDWDEQSAQMEMRKVTEALHDARRRGLAFVEATEVYSGIMGIMN